MEYLYLRGGWMNGCGEGSTGFLDREEMMLFIDICRFG